MLEGYKLYLKAIKNISPMSEQQWKEAMGITDDEEAIPVFVAHSSVKSKTIKPTLDAHSDMVKKQSPL